MTKLLEIMRENTKKVAFRNAVINQQYKTSGADAVKCIVRPTFHPHDGRVHARIPVTHLKELFT